MGVLIGALLSLAGAALLVVGTLGWAARLPRNRWVGVRTPAALRSDAAFVAGNRAAGPVVAAGGLVALAGGLVAVSATGVALVVVVVAAGVGTVALVLAGGVLGHRVAEDVPAPRRIGGCADCVCGAAGRCVGADALASDSARADASAQFRDGSLG